MKYREFAEKLKEEYNRRFPKSMCAVNLYNSLGCSIFVNCYLAGGKSEFINGISQNDMFHVGFYISLPENFNEDMELPENLVMEGNGNYYMIKPEISYLAFSQRKIPYRKTTGTPQKLISATGKFYDKLLVAVKADMKNRNIHKEHSALLAEKLEGTK